MKYTRKGLATSKKKTSLKENLWHTFNLIASGLKLFIALLTDHHDFDQMSLKTLLCLNVSVLFL